MSVYDFVQPFKGRFGGCTYDSSFPVQKTIMDRIDVLGRVGQCAPLSIVMPLTVEPSKPRLCQDQRYLNCWMRDMPFRLDSLVDVTHYLEKDHFQTKLDDKSGYDHVMMDDESRLLMVFQWGDGGLLITCSPLAGKSPHIFTSPSAWEQPRKSAVKMFHVSSISMIAIWGSVDPGHLNRPILRSTGQAVSNWRQQPTMYLWDTS